MEARLGAVLAARKRARPHPLPDVSSDTIDGGDAPRRLVDAPRLARRDVGAPGRVEGHVVIRGSAPPDGVHDPVPLKLRGQSISRALHAFEHHVSASMIGLAKRAVSLTACSQLSMTQGQLVTRLQTLAARFLIQVVQRIPERDALHRTILAARLVIGRIVQHLARPLSLGRLVILNQQKVTS